MKYDFITILKLIVATFLPVILSIIIYLFEKKNKFKKLNYITKQIIIGILFTLITIIDTQYGIQIDGATLNVRNAAPLTAGLLFGSYAGIISGTLGAIYRFFATYWGAGEFSQIACTIGCFLAGLFGALCRKFMFNNKKPSWIYGLAIGATTEVLHMLLVFLTNMNDVYNAYRVVEACALPMIVCNALSVMLSLLFVSIIGKEKIRKPFHSRKLSQIFQFLLMICVVLAFLATTIFTFSLQTRISTANADGLLKLNLEDVKKDVKEASDNNLLNISRKIALKVNNTTSKESLLTLCEEYDVVGINIVNNKGIIIQSTMDEFIGYDMGSGQQSSEFLCLLNSDTNEFVQSYQALSSDESIYRKYAGVVLEDGGFVQVGYDAFRFQKAISEEINLAIKNRHIGQEGKVIVCDENLIIIGGDDNLIGKSVKELDNSKNIEANTNTLFVATIGENKSYCMYLITEGFYLIATLPISEALFSRNIAVTILAFMEIIVFASLFAHIYFLLKKLIVDNIHKVNSSLGQITSGNLNVYVNVRENEEFASLSDDINATVDTLKRYIDEAKQRIDRELEFARQIQHSSLPSIFPPYPNKKEFDIYAFMEAAKEVGGDFYDYYLVDENHIAFLIADVSGKGIPAAMFMMKAKTLIKNLIESGKNIDEVFMEANKSLVENNDAEMFVTAWLGKIDLKTNILEYVNAGHNPPIIRKKNNEVFYLKTKPNFVLAGMEFSKYTKHELQLDKGDEILLYTDGVTEACDIDNKLYGEKRLIDIITTLSFNPVSVCNDIRKDIEKFVNDAEQSDDITMLCIKLNDFIEKKIDVLVNEKSTVTIMDFIKETLDSLSLNSKISNKVQVCVDEIYSNIVNYSNAKTASVILNKNDEEITLEFVDDGIKYDPTKNENPDITLSIDERKIGGLGIFMVRKMANEMNYQYLNNKNHLTIKFKLK